MFCILIFLIMTNVIESNDYTVLKELAKGTFGTVYLCLDKHNKKCCVKSIQIRQRNDISYNHIEVIKREIYILMNLKHPRILTMYKHFKTDTFVFIVMEYVTNGTLKELIDQRKTKETMFLQKDILDYLCDILLGLEYLHFKDVVHGDLKTENILIGGNGRIKIADFGVSKCVSQPVKLSSLARSTPLYTAPEALFDVTKFSFSSDIWSLGCVFYELCMLQHPFHRTYCIEDLANMASRGIYQSIDYKRKNYDQSLLTLSEMMLEPKVEKRATIAKIVCQPIVTIRYYENYFNYDSVYTIL